MPWLRYQRLVKSRLDQYDDMMCVFELSDISVFFHIGVYSFGVFFGAVFFGE